MRHQYRPHRRPSWRGGGPPCLVFHTDSLRGADELPDAAIETVGLVGTAFTMEQPFYRDRLAERGVTVLVPSADDRAVVHRVIYDELCVGVVSEESRTAYPEIIGRPREGH